ncbi:hypothetical protein [Streptomyces sp. NPDC005180]|uniref:hypothetical protein n=1 Tax=unclassified Streptomyces TaxID=2593676 RepID=UPI0033B258E2
MTSVLREAAALLRRRAAEAAQTPDERWMVDQDEAGGLAVAVFTPDDVDPDNMIFGLGGLFGVQLLPEAPSRAAAHAGGTRQAKAGLAGLR